MATQIDYGSCISQPVNGINRLVVDAVLQLHTTITMALPIIDIDQVNPFWFYRMDEHVLVELNQSKRYSAPNGDDVYLVLFQRK